GDQGRVRKRFLCSKIPLREADEALKVGTKYRQIFGTSLRRILGQRIINHPLRERRIEFAACALAHQDTRAAKPATAVMPLVALPEHTTPSIRARRDDQHAASGAETGTDRVDDLGVRIERGPVVRIEIGDPCSHLSSRSTSMKRSPNEPAAWRPPRTLLACSWCPAWITAESRPMAPALLTPA